MKTFRAANREDTHQPLVSVIVNCFNGGEYIDEVVGSVLSQTYRNWELIFWDNQSADESAKIFRRHKDTRLQYFLSEEHTPLYHARRLAVDHSSGTFIAFHDVDDYWFPEKIELQVEAAISSGAALVYSDYFFENRKTKSKKVIKSNRLVGGGAFEQLTKNYSIALSTLMVRRDVYCQVGGFDSRFNIIGDFDLVLRISAKHSIYCVQRPLASYRWHGANLSAKEPGAENQEITLWLATYSNESWATQSGINSLNERVVYGLIKEKCKTNQRRSAIVLIWRIHKARLFFRACFWLLLPSSLAVKLEA